MNGAEKPAMLPIVLISATPAAAATPVRNCVGSVQKFGRAAKIAIAVTEITAMVAAGEPANRASGMLTAPARAGITMCQVFRPRRVASRDQSHRAMAAGTYGIAVIRPFWIGSNASTPAWSWKPVMIVGRKNARA